MKKLAILVAALALPIAALADNVADIKTGVDVVVKNAGGKASLFIGGNATTATAVLPATQTLHVSKPANSLTFNLNPATLLPGFGLTGPITATGTDLGGGKGDFQLSDTSDVGKTITFSMGGANYSFVVSGFSGSYNATATQLGQPIEDPFDHNFRGSELYPDAVGPGGIKITGTVNGTPSELLIAPNITVLGGVALSQFVKSLSFQTSTGSVIEGDFIDTTVTLGEAAPAGGATINLGASDNLQTHSTVTVPGGATSATFKVAAGAEGWAFLQATLNGTPYSAMATIKVDFLLTSITLMSGSNGTVPGGSIATFSVNLSRPAGTNGVVVQFHSDDPNVVVGNSITIPAGQASGTFMCRMPLVSQAEDVTILARTPTDANSQATVAVKVHVT